MDEALFLPSLGQFLEVEVLPMVSVLAGLGSWENLMRVCFLMLLSHRDFSIYIDEHSTTGGPTCQMIFMCASNQGTVAPPHCSSAL